MVIYTDFSFFFLAAVYNFVPPHNVTARKLVNNFVFLHINTRSPTQNNEVLTKDIVVVLDGSGSIVRNEFDKGKAALRNMIGLERKGENDTNYAAVTFSNSAVINFSFLPYAEAANEILKIPYPSGGTNTQAGLAKAKTLFDISSSGITILRSVKYACGDGKSQS